MDSYHEHGLEPFLDPEVLASLAALAEPRRARLVSVLRHGEHCVCDLGDMLGMSTALVSHHLRSLRSAGLVRERRSGRWVYYTLDVERLAAFRAQLSEFLTPTATSQATCGCTDCSSRGLPDRRPVPAAESVGLGI